jgi:hypothetical protein
MQKMLMCFDGPAAAHMSQMVPLARCFQSEFEIDCMSLNAVTYQFMEYLPFISSILPLQYKDGNVFEISSQEGLTSNTDFYYFDSRTAIMDLSVSETKLHPLLQEKLDNYDKIFLLYDKNHINDSRMNADNRIIGFFHLILKQCRHKSIGRVNDWLHEMSPKSYNKYIPQEVVESMGFKYNDQLLQLEYDWYNEFNPNLNIESKSVCVTFSGGCETYFPDVPNKREYHKGKRIMNLLKSNGFQVIKTNRKESICRQIYYSQCKYHIGIDSVVHWMYKCFKNDGKNVFSIQPLLYSHMEQQLDLQCIVKDIIDPSPEIIVDRFMSKILQFSF